MVTYRGVRDPNGTTVKVEHGETTGILSPRFDLRNHSPTGFEWGYGGSGPAQLALALAAHVLHDDDRAIRVYQKLKFKIIARFEFNTWALTEEELLDAIAKIEQEDSPLPA